VSVGVLLVSHPGVANVLLETARAVVKLMPLKIAVLEVPWKVDVAAMTYQANHLLRELDDGHGVLILTDLYGASPANVTEHLEPCRKLRRVSGLNLSMLLRVLTYSDYKLDALAELAFEGGRAGIISDHA
jgi:PTS system mannose-specific IIA component